MKKLILALFTVLFVTACAPHTAGLMAGSKGEVRIDNSTFGKEVEVQSVMARPEGGFLQGSGTIVSKVSTDLRLQYKFTWFDTSGMTIDDEGVSWKSVKLHGKQQLQVSAVAPNANASRFELYVRKAFSN
ncbi:YcfL family protein [Shewanella kaireitica]|uniref:YcfL family protein n=1 Tax=Shewanella kaireitica TaxID=212021 RepID=UPI00201018DA|nr:YcfL family protein [Shewanella kaireitica]MCL1094347.1 YcfL family protein [Shewanella kaireitica]